MKLTTKPDARITWATIDKYWAETPRREGSRSINLFIEESYPYRDQYHWLWLFLWCSVRTKFFTTDAYTKHCDPGALGENFQTDRMGAKAAAAEFSKYDDTRMLDDEAAMMKEYEAILEFSIGANPRAEEPNPLPPPIIVPPPPPPAPVEPEPKKPETPAEPAKAAWKTYAKWAALVMGALAAPAYAFLPAIGDFVYSIILKWLQSVGG